MSEKENIYSSKIKHSGIFDFSEFYNFCYDWMRDEGQMFIVEELYSEKLSGEAKNIDVEWDCTRKVTDYFKFQIKVKFKVLGLQKVEITKGNAKIKTNKGQVEVKANAILVMDYQGKFEKNAFQKFLRAIYEKWIIASRIEQFEDKLTGDADEFLNQAKAYLDLEGKK